MCVLAFAWQKHPDLPVVLAGNRDEFHVRPTASADWWDDRPEILAGRDLEGGGTWMGLSRNGRFAVVTNIREPRVSGPANPPSRGSLVSGYLASVQPPSNWFADLDLEAYRGFNLIFGDREQAWYASNRASTPVSLEPGLYGLSNHLLDTPWPKLIAVRDGLERCLIPAGPGIEGLFDVLADRQRPPPHLLPNTGVPEEWEQLLSSVFIVHPDYGTRASTVMLLEGGGSAYLEERGFDASGEQLEVRRFRFELS